MELLAKTIIRHYIKKDFFGRLGTSLDEIEDAFQFKPSKEIKQILRQKYVEIIHKEPHNAINLIDRYLKVTGRHSESADFLNSVYEESIRIIYNRIEQGGNKNLLLKLRKRIKKKCEDTAIDKKNNMEFDADQVEIRFSR